jgi:hypothetical protein
MVLSDATKGITIKQPVLLIIHYSLVTTSADAAAVQICSQCYASSSLHRASARSGVGLRSYLTCDLASACHVVRLAAAESCTRCELSLPACCLHPGARCVCIGSLLAITYRYNGRGGLRSPMPFSARITDTPLPLSRRAPQSGTSRVHSTRQCLVRRCSHH